MAKASASALSGFDASDLSVTNGTASNVQTQDNRTFTADVTPQADGPVTVTVQANVAQDAVQLGNAASNTVTVTSDRTAPVPVVTTTEPNPTAAATIPITVAFGETVTGFDLSDVGVGNGALSGTVTDG